MLELPRQQRLRDRADHRIAADRDRRRLQAGREPWPDCLLLLGDQVYADEPSPETLEFIRGRRDISQPPGAQVADFEEYARLYREAWSDPDIRWLLATVPSTMIFDDHDVHDDWNISESWVQEMRAKPWWEPRVVGAFMAYWIYQHLGNQAPPELAGDALIQRVEAADDAGPLLREFAHMADRESAASRWAYHRDFGRSRLVVVDSRAARVLADVTGQTPKIEPGRTVSAAVSGDEAMTATVARLAQAGIAVTELSLSLPSLDEVFFTLTGRNASNDDLQEAA